MLELRGDLFAQDADAICLTTNGATDSRGRAVMGRGCALAGAQRWPGLPRLLGSVLRDRGNRVHRLTTAEGHERRLGQRRVPYDVVAFPVKPAVVVNTGANVVAHHPCRYAVGQPVPGGRVAPISS
jgi:hypothetical protein